MATPAYIAVGLPPFSDHVYVEKMRRLARDLNTDGCSGLALQFYALTCEEHDIHYRTHQTVYGRVITRQQADRILRDRTYELSWIRQYSPIARWRYSALRAFGKPAWDAEGRGTPLHDYPLLFWWPKRK